MERHIVGLGGGGDTAEQTRLLHDYVLGLTGKPSAEAALRADRCRGIGGGDRRFYELFRGRAELNHLCTFPWPPEDLRDLILSQDAICVSGGNTANMLAIWKTHGIDVLLREAWESGIVLWGASAGMICWFEAGVTDSFGPQLAGLDCLGFLAGSACPHYDGEEQRRPRYHALVDAGFPEGIAADDGVGLHYVGSELREIVTCRPGAAAYRITRDGEEKLPARELG